MTPRVFVACEYSGTVRDAFLKRGIFAVSCDVLPTESPLGSTLGGVPIHYQHDVLEVLGEVAGGFNVLIAHPPCTYLTCAAEWAYNDRQTKNIRPGTLTGAARRAAREDALDFVRELWAVPIRYKALENPVGVLSTRWRAPSQIIQPHDYGDDASKTTCLWLAGLPPLAPTEKVRGRLVCCGATYHYNAGEFALCPRCGGRNRPRERWANQTDSGQNREPPGVDRGKIRSKFYPGWADAMAQQWGDYLATQQENAP